VQALPVHANVRSAGLCVVALSAQARFTPRQWVVPALLVDAAVVGTRIAVVATGGTAFVTAGNPPGAASFTAQIDRAWISVFAQLQRTAVNVAEFIHWLLVIARAFITPVSRIWIAVLAHGLGLKADTEGAEPRVAFVRRRRAVGVDLARLLHATRYGIVLAFSGV
jgi:hypothetical protein